MKSFFKDRETENQNNISGFPGFLVYFSRSRSWGLTHCDLLSVFAIRITGTEGNVTVGLLK